MLSPKKKLRGIVIFIFPQWGVHSLEKWITYIVSSKNVTSKYLTFYIVISLVRTLLSRNFSHPHSIHTILCWFHEKLLCDVTESGNLFSPFFSGKNFVKATDLLKKLLKSWFHEIFFQWEIISHFSTRHCVYVKKSVSWIFN